MVVLPWWWWAVGMPGAAGVAGPVPQPRPPVPLIPHPGRLPPPHGCLRGEEIRHKLDRNSVINLFLTDLTLILN